MIINGFNSVSMLITGSGQVPDERLKQFYSYFIKCACVSCFARSIAGPLEKHVVRAVV